MTISIMFHKQYGPWAVVAGASEGLGAAYADQLAQRGFNLVLIARRENLLQALGKELREKHNVEVKTFALDLSLGNSAEIIMGETSDLEIGLLIYNAAFSAVGPFLERPISDHLKEIDTNIRTPLALVHYFGQRMSARGHGGIILMASLSAFQGSAFISNYAATKAFNMLLAEGLWEEWRKQGIDALVCIAGAIRTSNYLASTPRQTGRFSDATIEPEMVAREALAALGQQPYIIPGRSNRLASFFMRHLLPRRLAIQLMGRILRDMYAS
jgi:short-subunit dehydrogenase